MFLRLVAGVAILAATVAMGGAQAVTPSDPLAATWTYGALNLPAAWEVTTGSESVIIAVVDSGVDASHPDLVGAVDRGYDFVDGDDDATDPSGHGTAVAGIAGARANNGVGAAGVCWRCRIMPLRVIGAQGFALNPTIGRAIDFAVDHGAAVVNVSLYGENRSGLLQEAVRRARASGVPVIAAAGNEGGTLYEYPAGYPETIAVGAIDERNVLADYSSRGDWVKLAAPGCTPTTQLGGGFGAGCGTSGATPLVAGVAALLRTAAPFASAREIEDALERTARPVPGVRFGLVDASAALRELGSPKPHLEPSVEGDPALGAKLTAYSGVWAGAGLEVSVRWERCRVGLCEAAGDGLVHLVTKADGDHALRAVLSAPGAETAASPLTELIPAAPHNAAAPSISGRPVVGKVLTGTRGSWTGTSLAFEYQWLRCGTATCRSVETVGWSRRYRVRAADRGHWLRFAVAAVNSAGRATASSPRTRKIR